MNVLDIIMIAILLLSVLFGILKGFVRELLSLAFFIIAVVLAFLFYSEVGELFIGSMKDRDVANFTGFLTIFVIVLIIGSLVTYFAKKIFTVGPLKSIDMILGGVFGFVRGVLVACIIVFALIAFPVNDNLIIHSRLSPYVMKAIDVFFNLLPAKYKGQLDLIRRTVP